MSQIIISTVGTFGDLHPFLAIGATLKERGHQIVFAVEKIFIERCQSAGFETICLTGDSEALLAPYSQELASSGNTTRGMEILIKHWVLPTLPSKIKELRDIIKTADLLIASPFQYAASAAAELTGTPWVTISISPNTIPSIHVAKTPWVVDLPVLKKVVNRLMWAYDARVYRKMIDRPVNQIRQTFGLPPKQDFVTSGNFSPDLTLVSSSKAFVSRKPDWPPNIKLIGFPYWDGAETWESPEVLNRFLETDKKVISIFYGSMSRGSHDTFSTNQFYHTCIAAVHSLGARTLVIAPPRDIEDELSSEDTLTLAYAPFSKVFPHCALCVHHGGLGTTALLLKSGVPQLAIPAAFDQFFYAAQIKELGVGLTLSQQTFSKLTVTKAVKNLLSDNKYLAKAKQLSKIIENEDSESKLVREIEGYLQTVEKPIHQTFQSKWNKQN